MAPGTVPRRWLRASPVLAVVVVLVAQTVVLRALRVPLALQGAVWATVAGAALAGAGFLRRATAAIDDPSARFALWFLAGMLVITGVSYVLFHPVIARALGLNSPAAATGLSLALVGLSALLVGVGRRPASTARVSGLGMGDAATLVLALALSGATTYGAVNTTAVDPQYYDGESVLAALDSEHPLADSSVSEWGYRGDFYLHLVEWPALIHERGLPLEPIGHEGLQVWLLSSSLGFDAFDVADPVQAAKVLSVPVWFSLLTLARFVTRRALGVGRLASMAAVAGVALFAPLNYPLLETGRSSYLGFIGSSGSLYHNAPQLYSVALGMAALALIGVAAAEDRLRGEPFVAAAALVAASFWFKPSLFVVMAPAVVVAAALSWREHRRAALGSVAVLLLPVVWWVAYPLLVGVPAAVPHAEVDPFAFYSAYAADRFPARVSANTWLLAAAILGLSFAAWVVPTAGWWGRTVGAFRRRGRAALAITRRSLVPVVAVVGLGVGLGMAVLLVEEGDRATHGNFTWSVAAAYLLSLPVLVRLVVDVRSAVWRSVAWALFALHLAAGGLHLWILVTAGHL